MSDMQNIETTSAVPEHTPEGEVHPPSPSRRAAAVEAAYILEAVRR